MRLLFVRELFRHRSGLSAKYGRSGGVTPLLGVLRGPRPLTHHPQPLLVQRASRLLGLAFIRFPVKAPCICLGHGHTTELGTRNCRTYSVGMIRPQVRSFNLTSWRGAGGAPLASQRWLLGKVIKLKTLLHWSGPAQGKARSAANRAARVRRRPCGRQHLRSFDIIRLFHRSSPPGDGSENLTSRGRTSRSSP